MERGWVLALAIAFGGGCDDGAEVVDGGSIEGAKDTGRGDDGGTADAAVDATAGDAGPEGDAGLPDAGRDAAQLDAATQPDAAPDAFVEPGAQCAAGALEFGRARPTGECIQIRPIDTVVPATEATIRVDCTDPEITALVDKRHLVMVPDAVTQDAIWLHLGGSGGQPTNTENIGMAAAAEGYRYISLAYPNEPSIADRCSCPDGPRPESCEEKIRVEILTGRDVTPWFDMAADEAIVPRLVALLRYLAEQRPGDGWETYLTAEGAPDWTRFAVSGFSQGGGMAGLIARDHAVARALYLSKGAGSSVTALSDPAAATPCAAHAECAGGTCCTLADHECDVPPADAVCLDPVPVAWALTGRDVDGDGLGDGGPETRATPGTRQFGLVHREEGAWAYSPEVFAAWGMGDRAGFVDADQGAPPYGGTHVLSTGLPPRNACSEHQSMGADACQPRRADGLPALWDAWRYAMGTPVE